MTKKEEQLAIRQEKYRRRQRLAWQKNPLFWLEDRFGEPTTHFKWSAIDGYDGHEWDGDADPLMKAWMSVAAGHHTAIEAATGTSKTFWLARVAYWFLDSFEDSLVVTTAPKREQLTMNLWAEMGKTFNKFKKLRPKAEMIDLKVRVEGLKHSQNRSDDLSDEELEEIDLTQSWIIRGWSAGSGSDEDSANKARGFHRKNMLIIVEETPGISNAVMNAFKNTCTGEHNIILAVGNPDNKLDQLHRFASLSYVRNYRISAYDYPNVVLSKEVFPGGASNKSIEERAEEYGKGSNMYNRMVKGMSPGEAEDSLVRLQWIVDCCRRPREAFDSVEAYEAELAQDDGSYNAVGVDVAQSEAGDKAANAWGKSNNLIHLHYFYCDNATHLAYNLIMDNEVLEKDGYTNYYTHKINEYNIPSACIGVDTVGIGVATLNAFVDNGYEVTSLQGKQWDEGIPEDENGNPLYRFANLRSQMYWEAREDLRNGKLNILITDKEILRKLQEELTSPKFEIRDNTVAVESKEKIRKRIGRSPDLADAFVYWNFVRKGYRMTPDIGMFV